MNDNFSQKESEIKNAGSAEEMMPLTRYRFNWFGLRLTNRELAFCIVVAIIVSVCLDLLGTADIKLMRFIPLDWWLPAIIGVAIAAVITRIHLDHPGCLILKFKAVSQQYNQEAQYPEEPTQRK